MKDGLQELTEEILKGELQYIDKNVTALLLPQSSVAEALHQKYIDITKDDQEHNLNVGSLTLGEMDIYSIEEVDIPSFEQFIVKNLTEHGYSKNRLNQILLNNRNSFIALDIDPLSQKFNKFEHDLNSICQTSKAIGSHITLNEYNLAKDELDALKVRFPSYFPCEKISLLDKANAFFTRHQLLMAIIAVISIGIGLI
jgi:hypothetical protein